MPDFEEKAVCRKAGGVLELAAEKGYEPIAFTKLWLVSKTAENLYRMDFHDVAQSKQYLLHSLELEYDLSKEDTILESGSDPLLMYWAGFTLMYLSFTESAEPKEILKIYDIEKVLKCYETLHTLSAPVAIDEIREQFKK